MMGAILALVYVIAAIWAYDLIFYKDPEKVYFYAGGPEASINRLGKKVILGWAFGVLWIPIAIILKLIGKR
jgi:hypothetical protein